MTLAPGDWLAVVFLVVAAWAVCCLSALVALVYFVAHGVILWPAIYVSGGLFVTLLLAGEAAYRWDRKHPWESP